MAHKEATRSIMVMNPEGVHLRAATLIGNLARQFESSISVAKGNMVVDAKSTPLHLVALGADQGEVLVLKANGPDSQRAIDALADLFAACFGECSDTHGKTHASPPPGKAGKKSPPRPVQPPRCEPRPPSS